MASVAHKAGHGGRRKYGRNRPKCERYRKEHRRERNKLRRAKSALRKNPKSKVARKVIAQFEHVADK